MCIISQSTDKWSLCIVLFCAVFVSPVEVHLVVMYCSDLSPIAHVILVKLRLLHSLVSLLLWTLDINLNIKKKKKFINVDMTFRCYEWLLFIFVCQSCLPVQHREVWNLCLVINVYCVKICSSKVWKNKIGICFLLFWLIIVYVLILSVVFLCLFHVCFGMFSWSFWKAVSTPPSSPSEEVQ